MWKSFRAYLQESPVNFFVGISGVVSVFFWLLFFLNNLHWFPRGDLWIYFALPADWAEWIHRPWTLFTYPFLHLNIIDFIINMLLLAFIGMQLAITEHEQKMYRTAWAGIVGGGVAFWAARQGFPSWFADERLDVLTGVSTVYTAWLGYAGVRYGKHRINMRLLGRWPWRALLFLFLLWDAVQLPMGNSGGHAAHLGAMLTGALWAWWGTKRLGRKPAPEKVMENYKSRSEKEIDRILDKINRHGMDSLTEQEKDILYRESRRNNRK